MTRAGWTLAAGLVLAIGVAGWLYRDNRALRSQLGELRAAGFGAPAATAPEPAPALEQDARDSAETARTLLRSFAAVTGRDRPEVEVPDRPRTRQERRLRFQERIASYLGRRPGETAEQYRDRVVPLMELALARPRQEVAEARRAAEEEAGVTEDQREQLDSAIADAQAELLELTNGAIQSGELTPYERNWTGMLEYTGGLGTLLGSTEQRIGEILTPEQRRAMAAQGFEWGELIGVTAPWESLDPPPGPPSR
ncbi:MAG TPA: hypothetical protein VML75_21905 [Kofleriaceae bacterium]|nr:hypothetical protein [Kofleriaceae bacterium]